MSVRSADPNDLNIEPPDVGDRVAHIIDGRLGRLAIEGAGGHEWFVHFDDGTKQWVVDWKLRDARGQS